LFCGKFKINLITLRKKPEDFFSPYLTLADEATASLDVDNETEIQKAISGLVKGKTVLVIAHRMRTVEKVRRINKEYHHGNQP